MSIDVRLNWFRSLPMSCIDVLDLWVDGNPVDRASRTLTYAGEALALEEWATRDDVWWGVANVATLSAVPALPLAQGLHQLVLDISVRIPSFAPGIGGEWPSMLDRVIATEVLQ